MGLFTNRQAAQALSPRQTLEAKYANARRDILVMLAFTIINIVLLVTNSNTYFLFSAYIPYLIADYAMYLCGKYPAEYYYDPSEILFGDEVFAVMMVIAAVILVLYLLSWFFSDKGRVGWLVFSLVLFGLDCLGLGIVMADMISLGASFADYLFDILFHVWFMASLIGGVAAYCKLKKLPAEEELPMQQEAEPAAIEE